MQICVDINNRVTGYATQGSFDNGVDLSADIPEGFLTDCTNYILVDGVLIYSPITKPAIPTMDEIIAALEAVQLEQILGGAL